MTQKPTTKNNAKSEACNPRQGPSGRRAAQPGARLEGRVPAYSTLR